MSKTRNYSIDTIQVMTRFFTVLQECKNTHRIASVSQYCREHGIDMPHLYVQRKDLNKGFFEIGWCVPLVRDCGVNADWLLTGRGTMFVK